MKRDIVVIPFPFSDLSGSKRRPALIIADWGAEDIILCQITSKTKFDGYQVDLSASDFETGNLPIESNIRPNKLFTAQRSIIISAAGKITSAKYDDVVKKIISLIS